MELEKKQLISVIVPVYNEEAAVGLLYREIIEVLNHLHQPAEIIFIDDGSTDDTFERLRSLHPIRIIRFRKNFGQTAALDAGFKAARGEIVITMDGDGQNDPRDIPRLLLKLNEGYDVVSGWRKKRKDPLAKRFASRCANVLRQFLIADEIHDSGCTLKAYRKECFESVDLYGAMHRFIPALLKIKGFKITEIVVQHRPRINGKTKYNWKRGIQGGLDMISIWFWKTYSSRPLHLFGAFGLALIGISVIAGIVAFYKKIWYGQDLSETALTELALFGFLIGIQFLVSGLIADMLSKNYYASSKDQPYLIKEVIEQ